MEGIKANELMLNNWVLLHGKYYQVEDFGDGEVVEPISLTEEILLKCGFKKINKIYFRKGALTIEVQSFGHFRVSFDGKMLVNLKHLHQLQNLYFALTNEELNIEL